MDIRAGSISAGFRGPPSMHPELDVKVQAEPRTGCDLHAFVHLDDLVFADAYELADLWGLPSLERGMLDPQRSAVLAGKPVAWTMSPAVVDLERPAYLQQSKLKAPEATTSMLHLLLHQPNISIPLHTRYVPPTVNLDGEVQLQIGSGAGEGDVSIMGYWACSASSADGAVRISPLAYVPPVAYNAAFTPIPAGLVQHELLVKVGTAATIWLLWLWTGREVLRTRSRSKA